MSAFERYLIQHALARGMVEDIEAYDGKRVLWTWNRMQEKTIVIWRRKCSL